MKDAEQGPEPTVRVTKYAVSVLPERHPQYRHYVITVQEMDRNRWAVIRRDECMGTDGDWDKGVEPFGRGGRWLDSHRFDEQAALEVARGAAPHVTVDGITAAEVLAGRTARPEL